MKVAFLNDTHCGTRNSSDIFINYQEKFYEEVFFPYLLSKGIKKIIHAGDYFEHRKYINFKAFNANRKHFLDKLVEHDIHMDIIPGNHDVFYKNTNELNSLEELLGAYSSHVHIYMEPTVVDYGGCPIALLPWVNNSNYESSVKFIQNCKSDILVGHLELNGFELLRGVMSTHGMEAALFKRFEAVFSGHFHAKSSKGNVHYLGSQFEFTWADAHDDKYFHIFDTSTREMTTVQNPITLFQKIVYNDELYDFENVDVSGLKGKYVKVIVEKKVDPYLFDKFIDRVNDEEAIEVKIAENFEEFTGASVEDSAISVEDTTTLLNSYIDGVSTDLSKDRLKGYMNKLYTEASNMEVC